MRKFAFIVLALILTACGGNPTPDSSAGLPTVAQLPTLTATLTFTPSQTATPSHTPTSTFTATITPTETVTVTPSTTITDTPTPTFTPSPSPTQRQSPLLFLAQVAARATVLPAQFQPPTPLPSQGNQSIPLVAQSPSSCPQLPPGGFGVLFFGTPALVGQLGCASGTATTVNNALQTFERGTMIWLNGPIYVLLDDGRFWRYDDSFVAGVDPESGGEVPPAGLLEPVRGFGKIWRTVPDVRSGLGWGTSAEAGGSATRQRFERGWMIDLTQRGDILVLVEDPGGATGSWQAYPGSF